MKSKNQALRLILGIYPKRLLKSNDLKEFSSTLFGYPTWLIERSEAEVGNFLKNVCLLLRPTGTSPQIKNLSKWLESIEEYRDSSTKEIAEFIKTEIAHLPEEQRIILLKILTGTFKSPVTKKCVVIGLSEALKQKPETLFLRLQANKLDEMLTVEMLEKPIKDETFFIPSKFHETVSVDNIESILQKDTELEVYGRREGIEAQYVKYGKLVQLWTKNGLLVTDQFPEIIEQVDDYRQKIVLQGQIVPADKNVSSEQLFSRLSKKMIVQKDVETCRAVFEYWKIVEGDQSALFKLQNLRQANVLNYARKEDLTDIHRNCRSLGYEGILIKPMSKLEYFYWKASTFAINAILMYVEFGSMENRGINSLTLGVRHNRDLIPVSKITAFSKHFNFGEIVVFVKEATIERFGPVRTVPAKYVYEIQFDGVSKSSRRKSGLILKNPKIIKKLNIDPRHASSLDHIKQLI